ncbi:hypothetical protein RO3G_10483 [Rhizopus delemar RA 99-880]|uniref:Transmembrane protein n=1 Tax=Rhizopus delemar (strain RA 99-880 / ATCC MYA-4621 / FGSC 9543 / NRRL 43880) TaxID=246409 RepID=I1CBE3_RHIO9|nr:hypothetical protein RO3G_10483 [Rhizopus delemar RA 99-880]|eukprot:EIE85773.1 hypothetical protein RO3G_10483 [Rhizopus delemar RA 99-880]
MKESPLIEGRDLLRDLLVDRLGHRLVGLLTIPEQPKAQQAVAHELECRKIAKHGLPIKREREADDEPCLGRLNSRLAGPNKRRRIGSCEAEPFRQQLKRKREDDDEGRDRPSKEQKLLLLLLVLLLLVVAGCCCCCFCSCFWFLLLLLAVVAVVPVVPVVSFFLLLLTF